MRRLRRCGFWSRLPRMIASASIAVTPGTWLSPSPTSVAPHVGQVASDSEGRTAEHHMQRGTTTDASVGVASSSMARLYPVGRRAEYPDGPGSTRYPQRVMVAVTPIRSSPAAWS